MKYFVFCMLVLIYGCKDIKKEYYSNGLLKSKTEYKNKLVHGKYFEYFENGNLHIDGNFKNGLLDGLQKVYFINGKIYWEADYKNGKRNGAYREYSDSGNLKLECLFINDKENGIATSFFSNGKIKSKTTFKNGIVSGDFKEYYNNGQLLSYAKLIDGKPKYKIEYDSFGNIINDFIDSLKFKDIRNIKPEIFIKSNRDYFKVNCADTIKLKVGNIPYSRISPLIINGTIIKTKKINEFVVIPKKTGILEIDILVKTDSGNQLLGVIKKKIEK